MLTTMASVNVTILAITPDSSFKIDTYAAHITVATSRPHVALGLPATYGSSSVMIG